MDMRNRHPSPNLSQESSDLVHSQLTHDTTVHQHFEVVPLQSFSRPDSCLFWKQQLLPRHSQPQEPIA